MVKNSLTFENRIRTFKPLGSYSKARRDMMSINLRHRTKQNLNKQSGKARGELAPRTFIPYTTGIRVALDNIIYSLIFRESVKKLSPFHYKCTLIWYQFM